MARGKLMVTISTPHRDGGWFRKALDAQKARIRVAVNEALERAAEEVWNMPETPRDASYRLANEAGAEMMRGHAVAGFELAAIFEGWAARWREHADGHPAAKMAELGPPYLGWKDETDEEFGWRMGAGIIALLKDFG